MIRNLKLAAIAATVAGGLAAQTTGRTNVLTTVPVVGGTMTATVNYPVTEAGNPYAMFWSPKYAGTFNLGIPFIQGLLRLDPALFQQLYTGAFNASGSVSTSLPIPNNPSLIGGTFDMQSADLNIGALTVYLADNDVTPYFIGAFGSALLATGTSPSIVTGDFQLATLNQTMVATNQPVPVATMQATRHYGQNGTVEGYAATFTNTSGNSDINSVRRDRVSRRLLTINGGTIALPNGYDIVLMRDKVNVKINYIVSIKQADGTCKILGTYTDSLRTATTSVSEFQAQVGFSDDGSIMCTTIRDTSNSAGAGIADKCWLVKTDGSNWTTSGTPVLDITTTAAAGHQYFDQTILMCKDRVFLGTGYGWYSANFSDSATNKLAPLTLPLTGTGKTNLFIFSVARHRSDDGTKAMLVIGGDGTASLREQDLVSITNISSAGYTLTNMTAFPTTTTIQQLGLSSVTQTTGQAYNTTGAVWTGSPANSSNGIKGAYSPDGSRYAFLVGNDGLLPGFPTPPAPPYTAIPGNLMVAKTDGSQAGTLVSPTAGLFDPQVNYMSDIAFVNNDTVVFFAGKYAFTYVGTTSASLTEVACDLYAYKISTNTVTNLTKTSTGSLVAPFTAGGTAGNIRVRSTFFSNNKNWWYFERGYGPQVTTLFANNLVGVNCSTLALKDVTGSEFSAGTAPAIYRSVSQTGTGYTTDPWAALEFSVRKSPVGNLAFFHAENAAGANGTVFNDTNIFAFDIENGGQAIQLTSNNGTGASTTVKSISQLNISPDGAWIAWAQRLTTSSAHEEVFAMPSTGGTAKQLSATRWSGTLYQSVTDGSIHWTGNYGGVWSLVWSVGTASVTCPTANVVAQQSLCDGSQPAPMDITAPPVAAPAKLIMILNGNGTP